LTAGALIASAAPANAGCMYGGLVISKCDGPIQPDGTWQRCTTINTSSDNHSYNDVTCRQLGPDQHPFGIAFNDPPTHIDD
jgi:hypothetical protein